MNILKKIPSLVVGVALAAGAFAQATAERGATDQTPPSMTDGVIKKVDPGTGKVTIRHGYIKHLDMPAMTMVFTVKDKSLLSNVKSGDKVRFAVVDEGGKMIVTELQSAP